MSDKYNGQYPTAWSQSDVDFYVNTGKEPAKTSNGLWVGDVVREGKDLVDWSLAEIYALARGELYTQKIVGDDSFYRVLRGKAVLDDRDATKWGEEELMDWLLFEKKPAKSPLGFYINDPNRWVKDVTAWSRDELIDLGLGYFGDLERSQMYILDEACAVFELPLGITFDDYKTFMSTGTKPALTSTGVLVNDRRRSGKLVTEWSEAEIEAWLLDEITVPEQLEGALLKFAIRHYGAGRYWSKAQLYSMVIEDTYPEIDYSQYSDDQLTILAEQDNDAEAKDEIIRRTPVVEETPIEPEPEVIEEPTPVEETIDEPVEEPEDLPADDAGTPGDPVEPEDGQVLPGSDDHGQAETEPDVEEPAEVLWTDLVKEDTPLYCALVSGLTDVVINDNERRRFLPASKWTPLELIGWARGEIPAGMNTTEQTLITALRGLCGAFVKNWHDDAVKAFAANQELPKGIEKGILVRDIVRDKKHPGDWSEDELRAWSAGEIITPVDPKAILLAMRVKMKIPGRLTDEQAKAFMVTGVLPEEEIPPIEPGRPVSERQLMAWLKGTLKLSADVNTDELFRLVRSLYKIDTHWTDDHIVAFYRHGSQPKRLADGTLVEDRLRDMQAPSQWSWKELRWFALGEIEANFTMDEALPRIRKLIEVQFAISPAHWSDQEVIEYLKSETKPKALETGVYLNDPTRAKKLPIEWRDAELKAWLKGEIEATVTADEEGLWEEVYQRFNVPLFWYREDAKAFVLYGTEVPSLPSGIWLRDRNRDARKAAHWTLRELKAWARGQILPGMNAPEADLIRQAIKSFGLSYHLSPESVKKRVSDITEESMTMTVKFVTEDLARYEKGRQDAGDNGVTAAPYQTLLDRCITRVTRLEGEDFVQGWTELLNFFHKNSKTICSAKKMYTGVGQMTITPKGLRHFQNMTTVLMCTCDPAGRDAAVKLINWSGALKELSNEKARQQILSYYSIQ